MICIDFTGWPFLGQLVQVVFATVLIPPSPCLEQGFRRAQPGMTASIRPGYCELSFCVLVVVIVVVVSAFVAFAAAVRLDVEGWRLK